MFTAIGKVMMNWLEQTGGAADMVRSAGFWLARSRFEFKQFVLQSITIGVDSFGVTALTSLRDGADQPVYGHGIGPAGRKYH